MERNGVAVRHGSVPCVSADDPLLLPGMIEAERARNAVRLTALAARRRTGQRPMVRQIFPRAARSHHRAQFSASRQLGEQCFCSLGVEVTPSSDYPHGLEPYAHIHRTVEEQVRSTNVLPRRKICGLGDR